MVKSTPSGRSTSWITATEGRKSKNRGKKCPSKPETVKQITVEKQASKAKRNNEEELRKNVEQM